MKRSLTSQRPRSIAIRGSFWGNYKSDGKKEGAILGALVFFLCLKGNFTSVDVRSTCICPSGPGSEAVRASLDKDPEYRCLPLNELVYQFLFSPLVFPGDEKYDP
eukprot:gene9168-18999_t